MHPLRDKKMTKATNTYCTLDQEDTDPDLKKKDRYISFRLLRKEVSELDAMAQSENLDRSKFIRSKIFTNKIAA
jgi:hypothetical protein